MMLKNYHLLWYWLIIRINDRVGYTVWLSDKIVKPTLTGFNFGNVTSEISGLIFILLKSVEAAHENGAPFLR